ncbi:penicillin-binding protein 2, partial [Treponema pallidum]
MRYFSLLPDRHMLFRIKVLTWLVVLVMLLYMRQLFVIQIVRGDSFKKKSLNISQRSKVIPAQRGEIFDRHADLPMVLNVNSFAVDMIPGEVPPEQFDTVLNKLSHILRVPISDIRKKIPDAVRRSFQTVELRSNVSYEDITAIAQIIDELPGVSWYSKPV